MRYSMGGFETPLHTDFPVSVFPNRVVCLSFVLAVVLGCDEIAVAGNGDYQGLAHAELR